MSLRILRLIIYCFLFQYFSNPILRLHFPSSSYVLHAFMYFPSFCLCVIDVSTGDDDRRNDLRWCGGDGSFWVSYFRGSCCCPFNKLISRLSGYEVYGTTCSGSGTREMRLCVWVIGDGKWLGSLPGWYHVDLRSLNGILWLWSVFFFPCSLSQCVEVPICEDLSRANSKAIG